MAMNPRLKIAITSLAFLIVLGTVFYHAVEGWRFLDAFYFTATTLTTVGYGDLHATKDLSKVFTAFFAIVGISIALYSLTIIGSDYFSKREQELIEGMKREPGKGPQSLDKHITRADKHVMTLLKRIDQQLKK